MAKLQKGKRKAERTTKRAPAAVAVDHPTIHRTPVQHHLIAAGLMLVLVIATYFTYSNSFGGRFVFDDSKWILAMSQDRNKQRDVYEVMQKSRRPIVEATLYWDYDNAEKIKATRAMIVDEFADSEQYHWTNLAIHMIAGLALFGFVRRTLLIGPFSRKVRDQAHYIAFAGALLWMLHPLNTQAVTYLIQRAESLMGMFYLLTLYSFTFVISSRNPAVRIIAAAFAIVFCAMGMGSKAVMVTAPFMVLAYDLFFGSRLAHSASADDDPDAPFSIADIPRRLRSIILKRGVAHGLLFLTLIVLFKVGVAQGVLAPKKNQNGTVGFSLNRSNRADKITPTEYLVTQFGVISRYLKLSVFPVNQALDYRWPILNFEGKDDWLKRPATFANAFLPGVLIVALGLAVVLALIRRPWLGFLGLWFFVILAPTSSFVPIRDPLYEHRMYLSLAAIMLLVVALLWWIGGRLKSYLPDTIQRGHIVAIACVPLAVVLGTLSFQRNALYADPVELWADNVAHRPQNDRGLNNYGKVLLDRIEDDLQEKLGAQPLSENEKKQTLDLAIATLQRATEIRPSFVNAWFNMGNAFIKRAKLIDDIERQKALAQRQTKKLLPETLQVIISDLESAAAAYNQAIKYQEGKASHYVMLGNVFTDAGTYHQDQGNIERAAEMFEKARATFLRGEQRAFKNTSPVLRSRLRFNLGNSHFRLASVQRGSFEAAIEWYRKAAEVNPKHPYAWTQIGNSYYELKDYEQAISAYRRGVADRPFEPAYNLARVRIATSLRTLGRLEEARTELEQLVAKAPNYALARNQLELINRLINGQAGSQPNRN